MQRNAEHAAPLHIGDVALANRAFLAPLSGITDLSFRTLAERFGAGMVVSEMIASAALGTGHTDMVRRLRGVGRLPHIVQLAGCEEKWMARGAQIASDGGADVIDINFGCPAKRVTSGYAGSALMRVPDKALRLVEAVAGATERPVTVKMRLGWDDDSLNAAQIARSAVNAGARLITVHARTRQQFYKGTARWALVRPVAEAVHVPVVVNGDILDEDTARRTLAQSGADAVMIGRGAQGQPWRVGAVGAALSGAPGPQVPEGDAFADLVAEHFAMGLEEYGPELGVRVMRKHLSWYLERVPEVSKADRRALLTAEDAGEVARRIPDLFGRYWRQAA